MARRICLSLVPISFAACRMVTAIGGIGGSCTTTIKGPLGIQSVAPSVAPQLLDASIPNLHPLPSSLSFFPVDPLGGQARAGDRTHPPRDRHEGRLTYEMHGAAGGLRGAVFLLAPNWLTHCFINGTWSCPEPHFAFCSRF